MRYVICWFLKRVGSINRRPQDKWSSGDVQIGLFVSDRLYYFYGVLAPVLWMNCHTTVVQQLRARRDNMGFLVLSCCRRITVSQQLQLPQLLEGLGFRVHRPVVP